MLDDKNIDKVTIIVESLLDGKKRRETFGVEELSSKNTGLLDMAILGEYIKEKFVLEDAVCFMRKETDELYGQIEFVSNQNKELSINLFKVEEKLLLVEGERNKLEKALLKTEIELSSTTGKLGQQEKEIQILEDKLFMSLLKNREVEEKLAKTNEKLFKVSDVPLLTMEKERKLKKNLVNLDVKSVLTNHEALQQERVCYRHRRGGSRLLGSEVMQILEIYKSKKDILVKLKKNKINQKTYYRVINRKYKNEKDNKEISEIALQMGVELPI